MVGSGRFMPPPSDGRPVVLFLRLSKENFVAELARNAAVAYEDEVRHPATG
jgi:hypothetical protein